MSPVLVSSVFGALAVLAYWLAERRAGRAERELAAARAEVLRLEAERDAAVAERAPKSSGPYRAPAARKLAGWPRYWRVRGHRERDGQDVFLSEVALRSDKRTALWGSAQEALPFATGEHARGTVKLLGDFARHTGDAIRDVRVEEAYES